jgi:hypothetical protein
VRKPAGSESAPWLPLGVLGALALIALALLAALLAR